MARAGTGEPAAAQAGVAAQIVASPRQLIYTAQLTVRASDVTAAVSRATSVVTATGGYVASENTSSSPGKPSRATATVTLKIPAAAYAPTLARLEAHAGARLSLTQHAQDVTQQVADVSSRVTSDQDAIAQLRALLKRAGSVSALLSVQDQINSEEASLESMLAQQRALARQTAYATVTLTVLGPKAVVKPKPTAPPPGLATGLSGGWRAFRLTMSWLAAIIGAVAPFAAALVVIGGIAIAVRRWLVARPGAGGRSARLRQRPDQLRR